MIPVGKALEELAKIIKDTDADDSEPDWIACHVLGCGRAALGLKKGIDDADLGKMTEIAKERATGKPLAQVIGYTEFLGLRIEVNGDVLCPRPETEELAEKAIVYLKGKKNARVLDLCTGSGCIAVAIAVNTSAEVVASDVSEKALAVAERNAESNGADVKFVLSDAFSDIKGKFDLIISNPPYIPAADIEKLDREVRDFEPRLALDGGKDGLDFYRIIAEDAEKRLESDGVLLLECGQGQARAVADMLKGFDCETYFDLEGVERMVKAVKKSV